ncbi:MAG: hypothetical protein VX127_07585 [Myxococcota bacterium]|nr:hypothetical protein [Myxococcota bacterium]
MVLIALLLACGAPKVDATNLPTIAVNTAMVAQSPAAVDAMRAPIERVLQAERLTATAVATNDAWAGLGTSGHRTAWLLERTDGALSLLIEADARRRATLVGRFQWEVSATVIVAQADLPTLEQTTVMRVTLPHSHQDERDALASAAPRIGHYAAGLVRQFHGQPE